MTRDAKAPSRDASSGESLLDEPAAAPADVGVDAELSPRLASLLDATAAPAPTSTAQHEPAVGPLCLATVVSVGDERVELKIGASFVEASLVHVHPAVMRTACERGEPVLVQRQPDGSYWVAGALRTQPTPGVDAVDEIALDAKRIKLRASEEIALEASTTSPLTGEHTTARVALRAAGELETYAQRILSKAEEVHKLIGRMLRIN